MRLARPIGIAAALLAGCTQSGSRTVSGQLDSSQLTLVNARVVAISSTGKVHVAPISASGAFRIDVPTGEPHTLRFANATSNPQIHDQFGVLQLGGGGHWFSLAAGGAIALGRVGRADRPATAAASSSDDGESEHEGGDAAEHEDDQSSTCDLQMGADQVALKADHDLASGDGANEVSDDDGQEAESDEERACSASAQSASPTTPVAGVR